MAGDFFVGSDAEKKSRKCRSRTTLVLLVVEPTSNLSPLLELVGAIWIIFILDFALKFLLAGQEHVDRLGVFPRTAEGRVSCFTSALYGFAVFGYA